MSFDVIESPIRGESILVSWRTSLASSYRLCNSRPPHNKRRPRVVRMSITMASPVTHAMICREHESRLTVAVELFNQLRYLLNALIHHLAGSQDINAYLPVGGAVILIALSVLLTLLGGLIPSRKAAKSDPVTALRTE